MVDALRRPLDAGDIRLFCVDSVDSESLYCRSSHPRARVERHRVYERYILEEVIPLMRAENGSPSFVAHGCSIGAYHAATIALRHPSLFDRLVALSGRYDLTRRVGHFEDLFESHYDEDIYFMTPTHFLPNLNDPFFLEPLRQMNITLAVGEQDPFHESNRILSQALLDKGVHHQLAVWPGEAHRARYWREMVQRYF